MTGERLVGEPARSQRLGPPARALEVAEIIGMCDRIVGEPGRRRHLFGWLKAPDAGAEQWLVVDSYYPASRLVVVCRADPPGPDDHLYGELVPQRGLRLLLLTPAELGDDRPRAEARLRELIAATGPAPPRIREAPDGPSESPVARAMASLALPPVVAPPERRRVSAGQAAAAERGARFVAAHRANGNGRANGTPPVAPRVPPRTAAHQHPQPRQTPALRAAPAPRPRPRPTSPGPTRLHADDLALGAALVLIVFVEVYVLVVRTALDQDRLLLAFGVALDAGARSLGTVAAARVGRLRWAWACAIGGSPVVAAFALFQSEGPVATEPAPLAGLIALLATFLVALALLGAALGI